MQLTASAGKVLWVALYVIADQFGMHHLQCSIQVLHFPITLWFIGSSHLLPDLTGLTGNINSNTFHPTSTMVSHSEYVDVAL